MNDSRSFKPVSRELAEKQNRDPESNIAWNARRWGQQEGWLEHDRFGYEWGSRGHRHTAATVAQFFDTQLRPYLKSRYDLDILEIAPGAGRVTVELIRYAKSLTLVDLNSAAIEICKERLKYYPTPVSYYVNDGRSLECVSGVEFDLIVSYDSLVHVHPEIIFDYLKQSFQLLRRNGLLWVDHAGKGARVKGRRSEVTVDLVRNRAEEIGLEVVEQVFRNDSDCISVFTKR